MGRRGKRGGRGRGRGEKVGDFEAKLAEFVKAQFAPGIQSTASELINPRSQVSILPRTTQHMSEVERQRRTLAYGRQKPYDSISYETLRAISRFSLVNAAIHARRRAQVRSVCRRYDGRRYKPGWDIVHVDHFRRDFDASKVDNLRDRINRVIPLIDSPHPKYDSTLSSLLVKLVEDHLCLDRMVVNTLRGQAPASDAANPYPTIQMTHVDGSSVWPCDLYLDHFLRLNGIETNLGQPDIDAGLTHFRETYDVDLRDVAWVQVDPMFGGDAPIAFLSDRDVRVIVTNPSPEMHQFGFGVSPCESSYIAASLYLHGVSYVATFFRDSFSEMVGILAGPQYQKKDAQVLADMLRTHHAGVGQQHNTPILKLAGQQGDLQFVPTRQSSARDMAFPETMHNATMLIHAHYGMDPAETFTDAQSPSSPASLQAADREGQIEVSRDEGLFNLLDVLAEQVLTPIIQEWDPELKFAWFGLDEKDEQLDVSLRAQRLNGWQTINEGRKEEGMELIEDEWADLPLPFAQQAYAAQMQQKQMEEQMQAEQAQAGPEAPGQDGMPASPGQQQPEEPPGQAGMAGFSGRPANPGKGGMDGNEPDPAVPPRSQEDHHKWDEGAKGFIEFTVGDD